MKRRNLSPEDILAAQRLKDIWNARKSDLDLTQERAAEILGFATQGAVSHYLNAQTPLNLEAVLKFAGLLKIAPEMIRPELAELFNVARSYVPSDTPCNTQQISGQTNQDTASATIKIGSKEQELLQTFNAFPEEDQEQMLKEMKDKKESMDKTVERWLAAQRGRRA